MNSQVVTLTAVTSTGNLTQIFPAGMTAGPGTGAPGSMKRMTSSGCLFRAEVCPDGANGGVLELWDVDGSDGGANVDTGTTITNAQLNVSLALSPRRARLIYTQSFSGAGAGDVRAQSIVPAGLHINWGLAARFIGAAGTCSLNVSMEGCGKKIWIAGT